MSITTNKRFNVKAKDQTSFYTAIGEPRVNVEGFVQLYDADGEIMESLGGGGAGGGSIVYTNASGDFTATANDGTKTITITGLPFTLEKIHVVAGSIQKITTAGLVSDVDMDNIAVAAGVITLSAADDFVATDTVYVTLIGPDKWYDRDLDSAKNIVQNPDYAHYTDVEEIIEADLGITSTSTGGDTNTLTDTGAAFDPEDVAVGYVAYQVTDAETATINSVTDGTNIETTVLTGAASWDTKVYALPECKRFEISAESYKYMSIQLKLVAGDGNNACYVKLYSSNNADADTTDDTDWVDVSIPVLGAPQISADGIGAALAVTTEGIYFINSPTIVLKYMLKLICECEDATPDNDIEIYIKKG